MNEQRGGDGAVRQFAGEFETHLTVRAQNRGEGDDPIRLWRNTTESSTAHRSRPGTNTGPAHADLSGARASGRAAGDGTEWSQRLQDDGFRVVRLKIEAAPWNADVPETDDEAADLPGHCYFEHHAKLVLSSESQVAAVRALAAPHSAHVSRNARRTSAHGRHERFVTQRCRGVGREEAGRRLDVLLRVLTAAGYEAVEVEKEFVVYDDNPAVDAGWIKGEPRLV